MRVEEQGILGSSSQGDFGDYGDFIICMYITTSPLHPNLPISPPPKPLFRNLGMLNAHPPTNMGRLRGESICPDRHLGGGAKPMLTFSGGGRGGGKKAQTPADVIYYSFLKY